MHLYVPVFLERPWLSSYGRHRFNEGMKVLRACSVSSHMASELLTPPLYCAGSLTAMSDEKA